MYWFPYAYFRGLSDIYFANKLTDQLIDVTSESGHRFPLWVPFVLVLGFTIIAAIAISITQAMESEQSIEEQFGLDSNPAEPEGKSE